MVKITTWVLHGLAWSCMVLHGLAWSCMVLHGLALYTFIYHTPIGGFLKSGYPQIIHVMFGFSLINHPAIGDSPYGNPLWNPQGTIKTKRPHASNLRCGAPAEAGRAPQAALEVAVAQLRGPGLGFGAMRPMEVKNGKFNKKGMETTRKSCMVDGLS